MTDLERYDAVLFDLDGVITSTADQHFTAWKQMFDEFLASREGGTFERSDYNKHVDGVPRFDGVRNFLRSRGVLLEEGRIDDNLQRETVHGLGNRKNALVNRIIEEQGVTPYEGTVRLLRQLHARGVRCAVVSSSRNTRTVLEAAGLSDMFDARVDGEVASEQGLAGKPAPDTFLAAAETLGVPPERAVVIEDALSGVAAGRAGGFGLVVGVDRVGQREALLGHGADVVVDDLEELVQRDG
jgi:beta-phosphoglucomutase family hydrolase